MSSQSKAEAMGIVLVRTDRTSERNAQGRPLRFFEFGWRIESQRRERSLLHVKWHTKAGAWQAAYRWAKNEIA